MTPLRPLHGIALAFATLAACATSTHPPVTSPLATNSCAQPNATCAWWLTATFAPSDTLIEGRRVRELRGDWQRASVLTIGKLSSVARGELSLLADSTGRFVVDGDFDGNGTIDRATVGVYRNRSGEEGRFLLIVTPANTPRPRVAFLVMQPGSAGFSVLTYSNRKLTWGNCMECDDFHFVIWTGKKFVLKYALSGEK